MKKIIVPLTLAFCLITLNSYAGDTHKAVKESIEKESQAFLSGDYDAWASYWVHEPYTQMTYVRNGMLNTNHSWDSLSDNMKKMFKEGNQQGMQIQKTNVDVHVMGDMALVYISEKVTTDFYGKEQPFEQMSTNVLKKEDGKWKFVSSNIVDHSTFENTAFNTEMQLNNVGYKLLANNQVDKAIDVFKLNTELYPEAFNTWDSLAEAYMVKGEKDKAVEYYRKSISLNKSNTNAQQMIDKIQTEG